MRGSCNGVSASLLDARPEHRMPATELQQHHAGRQSGVCDGQGNCPAQTTSNCPPFVCSANACLTSCSGTGTNQCVSGAACIGGTCQTCQSGLTACGNVCADLTRDNNHCGSCTTACSGGTPYCVNRSCAQCRALADCANGYLACSNNACVCRQKSSSNLLTNGGLDGAAGWMFSAPAAYAPTVDADNCPGSGSVASGALAYFLSPCVSASPNTGYTFGLRVRGQLICWLDYYAGSTCAGTDTGGSDTFILGTDGGTTWEGVTGFGTTAADTRGIRIHCSNPLGGGHFDQFYLNTGSGSF